MASSADLSEHELPRTISRPHALAMSSDGLLWVGSPSGLFRISQAGVLISTVKSEIACVDVTQWNPEKQMITIFGYSAEVPKGPYNRTTAEIFQEENPEKSIFQASFPPEIGRPRKIVISNSGNVFLSTKHEDPNIHPKWFTGGQKHLKPSKSSVYRLNIGEWINGTCRPEPIITKNPGNMWFMAIAEKYKFLAVSDLCDDVFHCVDVYDFDGTHLRRFVEGNKNVGSGLSGVCWPRGLAFDKNQENLFIADENMRIQKFRLEDGQFQGLICTLSDFKTTTNANLKPLIWRENRLYSVGFKPEEEVKTRSIGEQVTNSVPLLFIIKPC